MRDKIFIFAGKLFFSWTWENLFWVFFPIKLFLLQGKVIKKFMDFSHLPRVKAKMKRRWNVKPRLYHAYNERQFGIHKILKAKQLWHHFIKSNIFSFFFLLPSIKWCFFFGNIPSGWKRVWERRGKMLFENTHRVLNRREKL